MDIFKNILYLLWLELIGFTPSLQATSTSPFVTPTFRFEHPLSHLQLSSQGVHLAYLEKHPSRGLLLKVFEFKSQSIYDVSAGQIGAAFFWAPYGFRLFYREQKLASDSRGREQIHSTVWAYDAALHKNVEITKIPEASGFLTFDPLTQKMHTFAPERLYTHQILFPTSRLARWQMLRRRDQGHWLVTQNGVLWARQEGAILKRMEDDQSPISSFALSPDGQAIAWGTSKGQVYCSLSGQTPVTIGFGQHPSWHPSKRLLVFAGARMVGKVAASYDLRVSDMRGQGRWLTHSQHSQEHWPVWHPQGEAIWYTIAHTSDLFLMRLVSDKLASSKHPAIN